MSSEIQATIQENLEMKREIARLLTKIELLEAELEEWKAQFEPPEPPTSPPMPLDTAPDSYVHPLFRNLIPH
jgi:hypothetical protein